jgi:hypothetical protein
VKWQGNTKLHLVVSSLASATASACVAYVVASKVLDRKFQNQLTEEIQAAKELYQEMYSRPDAVEAPRSDEQLLSDVREATDVYDPPPDDPVGKALDAARQYGMEQTVEEQDDRPAPVIVNIFEDRTPPGEEVLQALLADRDITKPYVITREEYLDNEPDNEQLAFTYWTGDGILVDDRQEYNPIDDVDGVAGDENLLHFGYGSRDNNIVYIRNMVADPPYDLCVTKSTGTYSSEVLGMETEEGPHLAHSQLRRFRPTDE